MSEAVNAVWALILAGGASARMGRPKLLLPAPQGHVLQQTVHQALSSGSCRVAVITAKNGPIKRAHLKAGPELWAGAEARIASGSNSVQPPPLESVEWLETDSAARGLGASLAAGVRQLRARHSPAAILVLLGDQPEMKPEAIRRVAGTFRETGAWIVQARYEDHPAHPVLFAAPLFADLAALNGDVGAKELLRKYGERIVYANVPGPAPSDIDKPEDYLGYVRRAFSKS
ncbi:NTP transferase domain-containing protein [Paenibacillus macerans]|uniref:nucleotidyltransferase family protein n=1 Tax=Paenibacillus macerans TaxID=44252 RepID=UPI00203AB8B3|nr:nucleotidyltransferase family protein [Paenibacillus macerans]MCM3698875.1 nucleotidyltransferase family protein [Paenibacillus macerans]